MSAKTTTTAAAAPKTAAKPSTNGKKVPAPKPVVAKVEKPTTDLRKPQVRILYFLAKAKKAASRKDIAEGAPVDAANCVELIGSNDDAVRKANDAKHFPSLITRKLVTFAKPEEGQTAAVYEITAAGRKVVEQLKKDGIDGK